jgi:ABC-type multidrug transport system fused ATPase/permease subunit
VLAGAVGGVIKFTIPLLVPQVTRHMLDHVYANTAISTQAKIRELLLYVGGLIAIFILVWAPGTFARHYFTSKAGQKCIFDLRCDLYNHILCMSASFFENNQSGSIVSRIMGDVALAQNLVGRALTNVWMDAASAIAVLMFMFRIDASVTLVALTTLPLYAYVFKRLRKEIRSSSRQVRAEIADMSGNVQEKISGSHIIHAFTQEKNEERRFVRDSRHLFATTMRRAFYQSLNMTITGGLTHLSPLIVTLFGGYQVIRGHMSVGDWVAISLYLKPLYTPLKRFSDLNVVFANSMAALDRIFEVLDQDSRIRDRPNAIPLDGIEGRVESEHAHFAYPSPLGSKRRPVLKDISFTAEPGQRIALVGPSGAGKSTLVSLIPRFYDVRSGSVKIDGTDVRDLTIESLRHHIGFVFQEPILFTGTIWENLLYGNPRASRQEIIQACRAANAYDFIQILPDDFDTEVGESGTFLSGGQKQRLTIARAFLKDPKILILDEPTASLDAESEQLIQEAMDHLMVGRTTFIIAHRLATIVNADKILVLEGGRIVETGTHITLLKEEGLYCDLYKQQFESASASLDVLEAN